jgi:hypothetical protein
MDIKELRNKLVDLTGKVWRKTDSDERGFVFDWIHPDAPEGHARDGVQLSWFEGSDLVKVWSEDGVLMYQQELSKLDQRLDIAIGYSQMAGGLQKHIPDIENIPDANSCTQAVEALFLSGDFDPAFSGGEDGVCWWTEQGYVAEYDSINQSFLIWFEGNYWVAGTPEGYVEALKKADADREKILFNKLKSEVAGK